MENKDIVILFDVEQPSLGRNPTKLFFIIPSQFKGMQQIKEQDKMIHLPIVSCSPKVNITLMKGTRKLQMVCHNSFLKTCNTKQVRKSYFEGSIPTPHIMPESNFGAPTSNLVYLKSSPQALLIFFQSLTPYVPQTSFEHHQPHAVAYLESTNTLHKAFPHEHSTKATPAKDLG
jgi:hypothetical protein